MQTTRWSLLLFVLIAPLSIGCGGHSGGVVGEKDEVEDFFAENPDAAETVPDTFETDSTPPPSQQ